MFDSLDPEISSRQAWLGVLARAGAAEIQNGLRAAPELPGFIRLRGPEAGMAMVRGRIGGGADAFNLGEMTIARCTIRDSAGRTGHAYAAGRDLAKVELIARLDAALQDPALRAVYEPLVQNLAAAQADRRAATEARAAATEVKFFTLATMRS